MKRVSLGFIPFAAVCGLLFASLGATSRQVSDFEIIVETTATGLTATCKEGCVWKSVSYSCGEEAQSCRAKIDENGVGAVEGGE